jgi:hypothetical protein
MNATKNNPKPIKIESVEDYLKNIKKKKLDGFISRGENRCFKTKKINASAFRYDPPIDFPNIIKQFYDEIGNNLTSMQKDNFIAFSQHHGIPTNLIDFSRSPLVSLFFACYDERKNDEDGYVYFISPSRLININDIIGENIYYKNLLNDILSFDEYTLPVIIGLYKFEHDHFNEVVEMIIYWIKLLKQDKSLYFKYRNLYYCLNKFIKMHKNGNNSYDAFSKCRNDFLKCYIDSNLYDSDLYKDLMNFSLDKQEQNKFWELVEPTRMNTQYDYYEDILLVLVAIKVAFVELVDFSYKEEHFESFYLPFYLTYTPPHIIERINNQSSLFIYQLYYDNTLRDIFVEPLTDRITQSVIPDCTFQITNKAKIMKELDVLGINLKYIYNDYDNIAKYIRNTNIGSSSSL